MSVDTAAPEKVAELPGQDDLFPAPSAADAAPRVAKQPPPVAPDPQAPFGWMTDPKTGEVRPKRAPGRGAKSSGKPAATAPPANRAANKPRAVSGEPVAPERSYSEKVAELVDTLWMVTAATPIADGKFAGQDMREITIKVKAQGAILRDQRPSLVQGMATIADHSAMVRSGIDWISSDSGPGWLMPACMMLVPFAVQTMALWRGSVDQAAALAQRTVDEFAALAQRMGLVPAAPDPGGPAAAVSD